MPDVRGHDKFRLVTVRSNRITLFNPLSTSAAANLKFLGAGLFGGITRSPVITPDQ
jgi:hypothetical protein